jgi:hypothetical protein
MWLTNTVVCFDYAFIVSLFITVNANNSNNFLLKQQAITGYCNAKYFRGKCHLWGDDFYWAFRSVQNIGLIQIFAI